MAESKKFKFLVYYDTESKRCEGVPIRDTYGNQIGSAVVIADPGCNLPMVSNPRPTLEVREAELTVYPLKKLAKGEVTILKKKG